MPRNGDRNPNQSLGSTLTKIFKHLYTSNWESNFPSLRKINFDISDKINPKKFIGKTIYKIIGNKKKKTTSSFWTAMASVAPVMFMKVSIASWLGVAIKGRTSSELRIFTVSVRNFLSVSWRRKKGNACTLGEGTLYTCVVWEFIKIK